jgi:hypothetical protein
MSQVRTSFTFEANTQYFIKNWHSSTHSKLAIDFTFEVDTHSHFNLVFDIISRYNVQVSHSMLPFDFTFNIETQYYNGTLRDQLTKMHFSRKIRSAISSILLDQFLSHKTCFFPAGHILLAHNIVTLKNDTQYHILSWHSILHSNLTHNISFNLGQWHLITHSLRESLILHQMLVLIIKSLWRICGVFPFSCPSKSGQMKMRVMK